MARESTAVGVFSRPLRRISSPMPGTRGLRPPRVDSGVLSRGPIPVPPVRNDYVYAAGVGQARAIAREYSRDHRRRVAPTMTSQPNPRHTATTAGPDRSSRSPSRYCIADCEHRDSHRAGYLRFDRSFSRLASSISRIASISRPVVFRVVVVRVEAFAALKSISKSPAIQSTTCKQRHRPRFFRSWRRGTDHWQNRARPARRLVRTIRRHDFCPISSDCIRSIMLISSSRP